MKYHACYRTDYGLTCITVEAESRAEAIYALMNEHSELRMHPSRITRVTKIR